MEIHLPDGPDILLKKVDISLCEILREVALQTFTEAFGNQNTEEDLDQYLRESFSLEKLSSQIQKPSIHYFLICIGRETVGYVKLNEAASQSDVNDPRSIELERIYIKSDFQGKGLGEAVLNHFINFSKGRFEYIWLGVWEKNLKAIKFYEKSGFQKFAEHPFILGGDTQTDILMKLPL